MEHVINPFFFALVVMLTGYIAFKIGSRSVRMIALISGLVTLISVSSIGYIRSYYDVLVLGVCGMIIYLAMWKLVPQTAK